MTSLRFYSLAIGSSVLVVAGLAVLFRGKQLTPPQKERLRRLRISATGRITDGTVIDVQEIEEPGKPPIQLLIYTYDVAGVEYQCSQDITYLRQFVDVHSCRLGLQTSVKYDPHNPGNSIVISEDWTGLRR